MQLTEPVEFHDAEDNVLTVGDNAKFTKRNFPASSSSMVEAWCRCSGNPLAVVFAIKNNKFFL
ncbi:hypothetical protein N183_36850 [Sinorhizobium sp. Sb3]|nr:hypothetical protein N183_36850 [Sinorhizobium sp. Sb3]